MSYLTKQGTNGDISTLFQGHFINYNGDISTLFQVIDNDPEIASKYYHYYSEYVFSYVSY